MDDNPSDQAMQCLAALMKELHAVERRLPVLYRRAERIVREIEGGMPWADVLANAPDELIVNVLNDEITTLHDMAAQFRRAQMRALHAEGMTMESIAETFGVTRQRVSHMLRHV